MFENMGATIGFPGFVNEGFDGMKRQIPLDRPKIVLAQGYLFSHEKSVSQR